MTACHHEHIFTPTTQFPACSEVDTAVSTPERGDGDPGRPGDLTRDEVFDVLSSTRRRHVVHALVGNGGKTSIGALSKRLAQWENDLPDDRDVTARQRKRVYTALRQSHLPRLDEVGVVDYDPDRGTVELTARADALRPYLREPTRRPWPCYYVGVAVGGLLLTAGLVVGALPNQVTGTLVAALVCVVLAAVAGAHYAVARSSRRDRLAAEADTGATAAVEGAGPGRVETDSGVDEANPDER